MEDTLKRVSGSDTLLAESLIETNYFLFIYHFALENAPQHVPKMQNYVALFGLMRTLTFYFILLFWVASWHLIYSDASLLTIAITLPALSVVSYLFYLSFIKFYRRFTLEAMMAAAVVEKPTHQEKTIPS
jgi:apolipoprotein N-acyltransferase